MGRRRSASWPTNTSAALRGGWGVLKVAAYQQWRREVQALVDCGVPEAEARKKVRVPILSKPAIQKHLNQIKGDSRTGGLPEGELGPERPCPWWHEVST
ncbi:hypothetical protein ABT010_33725 [Streptomyces sp. NPDC002668]|uniref:hypothetical protein n=1 Tax=Streptomyces sp. NPDC002668 TaxID=3154422 RepID=UPI00332580A7